MKTVAALSALVALASSHATFQQLWKNGEDLESTCARLPPSNSPIEDYTSDALQCNVNPAAASGKCSFEAGDTVTIEMHQHNSRSCTEEGIGGAHWGPVLAYMSKVEDAASADGSSDFFKVYQNTWKKSPGSSQGDADFWGTKDLNYNCGKLDFKIPTDIAPGDYLLRAEAIALHAASSSGGAQHYVTCYQLTVTGSGTLIPKDTVTFPSAYTKTGPGLGFSIHTNMDSYPAPGPALIAGGTEATPQLLTFGNIAGVPAATGGGAAPVASKSAALEPSSVAPVATSPAAVSSKPAEPTAVPEDPTTAPVNNGASSVAALPTSQASVTAKPSPVAPSTMATVVRPQPTGSASGDIKEYNQCGGQGFKGTGSCAQGLTCKEWNPYYFQCVKEESGASKPVPTQPAAESPAPAQPEPTEVAPKDTTEKTYTLETFIAFLEQEAGGESASKIRRMIEALQM